MLLSPGPVVASLETRVCLTQRNILSLFILLYCTVLYSLYMNKHLQGMAPPPPYKYSTALRLKTSSLCLPKAPVRAKKLLYQDHLLLCEIQKFLTKDHTTIFRNANFYFFFKRKLCTLFSSLTSHVQQQRSRQDPDIMSVMGWPTHLTQDNFV